MRHFPFHLQHDTMQCGIACLRMICEHYGRKYSSDDIARLCHATAQGVSLLGISRAAEQLGLHTVCGRLTMESIEQAPLPCILHWNQNHFVVLHRISHHRGKPVYHIADPGKGLLKIGRDTMEQAWVSTRTDGNDKGIAMLLSATPAFSRYDGEVRVRRRSFGFLMGYISQYRQVFIVLSLLMAAGCLVQLALPLLMQKIVDVGIKQHDIGFVWLILLGQLASPWAAPQWTLSSASCCCMWA